MTPQVLKPGDIIKCHDMEELEAYARALKIAGYHFTENVIVSEKDGDKHWIEIVDPEQRVPFPDRGIDRTNEYKGLTADLIIIDEEAADDPEHNNPGI